MSRARPSSLIGLLVLVAGLAVAPGCGRDAGGPTEPGPGNVKLEPENRTEATIGRDGGVLTATNSAGLTFTLDVPPGAVPGDITIAMTPVQSIENLPFAGGLAAAVSLEPSGLNFIRPAWLAIETTATPGAGQHLVGFMYEDDAESFTYTAGAQVGDQVRVLVTHFSGAGAALASPEDLNSVGFADTLDITYRASDPGSDPDRWLDLMVEILEDDVLPAIESGSGDDLRLAVVKYFRWQELLRLEVIHGITDAYGILLDDHIVPARAVIARKLEEGIRVAKERCAFTGEVYPLTSVFEFYWQASFLDLDTPENGLDVESVLAGICGTAVIESVTLADPLPLNADESLDIDFALEIDGERLDAVFLVEVGGVGGTVQHEQGLTNAQGLYTVVVRRTLEAGVQFGIAGNLRLPMFDFNNTNSHYWPSLISVDDVVFRGGTATIEASFPGSVAPDQPTPLTLLVRQLVAPGQEEPVAGAVVTLTATGGTVTPDQVATGLDGRAQVSVTASGDESELVVTAVVTRNGVEIGRKDVSAAVANGAVVLLRLRSSVVIADALDNCVDSLRDEQQDSGTGAITLTAFSEGDCQVAGYHAYASAFVTHSSDPGVAADNRSAVLSFTTSAATSQELSEEGAAIARSYAYTGFYVAFDIQGGTMDFQLSASTTFTSSAAGGFLVRLHGPRGENDYDWYKEYSDGNPPQTMAAGSLPPGRYTCEFVASGGPAGDEIGTTLAGFGGEATLTLTQPAKTLAGARLQVGR